MKLIGRYNRDGFRIVNEDGKQVYHEGNSNDGKSVVSYDISRSLSSLRTRCESTLRFICKMKNCQVGDIAIDFTGGSNAD